MRVMGLGLRESGEQVTFLPPIFVIVDFFFTMELYIFLIIKLQGLV